LLNAEQRVYLRARGLHRPTIDRYQLAADGKAIVFPLYADGKLINAVWHRPWYALKYQAAKGHAAALFPDLPEERGVVLVAGMFDPLVARQHGVPAVTTTCGAVLPRHLAERFAGKRVAVCYDAGEESQAERAVGVLAGVGAVAWPVSLPLPPGGDVADWFLSGRSRRDLYRLIAEARRSV